MIYEEELNTLMGAYPIDVAIVANRWGGFRGLRSAVRNNDRVANAVLEPMWKHWIKNHKRDHDERAATFWKRVFG